MNEMRKLLELFNRNKSDEEFAEYVEYLRNLGSSDERYRTLYNWVVAGGTGAGYDSNVGITVDDFIKFVDYIEAM